MKQTEKKPYDAPLTACRLSIETLMNTASGNGVTSDEGIGYGGVDDGSHEPSSHLRSDLEFEAVMNEKDAWVEGLW